MVSRQNDRTAEFKAAARLLHRKSNVLNRAHPGQSATIRGTAFHSEGGVPMIIGATVIRSLNSPQRERLPHFKSGISIIKKVKLTVVTAASERLPFSESQSMERTNVFFEFDLDEYSVLVALFVNRKDLCGDGSHFTSLSTSDFAGDEKRPQRASGTDRHRRRRESRGHSRLPPTKSNLFANRRTGDVLNISAHRPH